MQRLRAIGMVLCLPALTSCGGAGASSSSALPGTNTSVQAKTAPVHLSFAVPAKVLAARKRSVEYVSASTTALTITTTPTGGAAQAPIYVACAASCVADFNAPVGSDSIALLLTDGANGSGNALSLSSTAETILPNVTNTFNLVANGVVNSVAFTVSGPSFLGGVPSDESITVSALDADGNTIVGPGNYVDASGNPVTINFAGTNSQAGGFGTVTLSQTAISAPLSAPITAHYDGGWLDHATVAVTSPATLAASSMSVSLPTVPNIVEYSTNLSANANPFDITSGPDGALWFTEANIDRIGRITTAGVISEFSTGITVGASPYGITSGPDGRLWFGEHGLGLIGAITPAGVVSQYPGGSSIRELTTGPDGNLWNTEQGHLAIDSTTTGGIGTSWSAGSIAPGSIGITSGSDGALWYTADSANKIGRITISGSISSYNVTGNPHYITAGPDGNLWFTQETGGCIGKITTAGALQNFCTGFTGPATTVGIVTGPDNNIWFTAYNAGHVDRITPAGVVTEFSTGITAGSKPFGIAVGNDHSLWFTESAGNRIGRFVL